MRALTAAAASVALAASTLAFGGSSSAQPQQSDVRAASAYAGSFALSGKQARDYLLPDDVRELWSTKLPGGKTQTRYQQMVDAASVFGGQVTVIINRAGRTQTVVGAYFPGLRPVNDRDLKKREARDVAEARIGERGDWSNKLRIDPRSGRLFYEVDSIREGSRPTRWIDADTGKVLKAYDAVTEGEGTGVKGDTKQVASTFNASTNLFELLSPDGRQATYSAGNTNGPTVYLETDEDDVWDLNIPPMRSPSQAPGVDAHYYSNVVDDFFADVFGRDSIDDSGMQIISIVHWGNSYCNAFWNGAYMTYGDGDGDTCLPLSGGLDVDGHELTHGVTEYTSGLIYEDESGALNEAFSDMMANTVEFYADKRRLDPAAEPDWRIGEDVINRDQPDAGFRNMGDPGEFDHPDHLVDLYTGPLDNGGVHANSGIANHAYFLAVRGGKNRGCTATAQRPATHTEDCDVRVKRIGLRRAAQVFYRGFTSLPEYANFCDARNATIASALDGSGRLQERMGDVWQAVGVYDGCEPGTPPPPPCEGDNNAQLPIESPHPYGNNGDCTWTYDHGQGGFSFHFSLLDVEKDWDYVYVKDGDGNVLATYTGTYPGGVESPCIPSSTGSVQLVSDQVVTAEGFTIDAVNACGGAAVRKSD